ncbi:MAG: bifunctional 2-polyprenyl-6-hydroxyphenol methylase/3-demethylubiquinol 3-O-methyltransferase UbiG [Gemmatimonadales bacterium]
MPVDNAVYDRHADTWWDERSFLHTLAALTPVRFGYMRRVLLTEVRFVPTGLRALDIGCGGGFLAEEFARLGFAVTGIDPSAPSLAVARTHAATQGLPITYWCAMGEALPFPDASFDVTYCCDVLEHVADIKRVIAESARVLRPGGVYLYDTINRTLRSKLIVIWLLQEWRWSSLMPPDLHDWQMFIRPAELRALLERHGLLPQGFTGLTPRAKPVRILRALRARKRGVLSHAEVFRRLDLGESADTSVLFMGYARKAPAGSVSN